MVQEAIQAIIDALSVGSLYALLSLGIALVFGIMGLINFAHGELITLGGYVLVMSAAFPDPWRIIFVFVICMLAALLMERVAFRPVRGAAADTLLVTSFAVSFLMQSLAILFLGALPKGAMILPSFSQPIRFAGLAVRPLDVLTIVVTLVLLVGLVLFLRHTSIGVQMRAAAEKFEMARLLGVRANYVIATAFAISGILAGIATVIVVAQTGLVGPMTGASLVFAAFVATIVGGLGTLSGAVLGAYVLGIITVLLQVILPSELRPYREAFVFTALVIILVFRPQGLLGTRRIRI